MAIWNSLRGKLMETNRGKIFLNTVFWGFILWLFGYVLGIIFFAFMPRDIIGWFVLPLGTIAMIWVLFNKIERESFGCYLGLGVVWTVMAIVLDYILIVRLFNSTDYYKPDVYLYYLLAILLPIVVGWYKLNKASKTGNSIRDI
jgi:hypothetical protein